MATKKEIEINLKSTLDGKGVEEAKQKIDSLNKSTEQLDKDSQRATKSIKNMGQGMLQVAYFMDDVQYGIKGILNNIPGLVIGFGGGAGLAGALSLATLAGAKLYEWMSSTEEKSVDLAEKIKEQAQALKDEFGNIQREADNKAVVSFEEKAAKRIAEYRKNEADSLERSYNYRKRLIDLESGIEDDEAEIARLKVEEDFANGKLGEGSEAERRRIRLLEGIELDSRARTRAVREEKAQVDIDEAVENRKKAEVGVSTISGNLRNAQDERILSLLDRQRIELEFNDLEKRAQKLRAEGREEGAHNIGLQMNDLRWRIEASDNALKEQGFNIGDGTSGEAGYSNAYTAYEKKLSSLREQHAKAEESLTEAIKKEEKATEVAAEIKTKNTSEEAVDIQRGRTSQAQERRQIREEIEKEDTENEIEGRKKEIETKKDALKKNKDNFSAELERLVVAAGESASEQQKAMVRAASEAIRNQVKNASADGIIDSAEYAQIGVAFRDALRQQGVQNKAILNGLSTNMKQSLSIVNQQAAELREQQSRIEQLTRDLKQAQNNIEGLRRRNH